MQQINNSWLGGQSAKLADYFHESIVFNSPDLKQQSIGKDICIESYADFLGKSKVLLFNQSNPRVHIFDYTAILAYDFEMKYEQKSKTYHETGTDVMIFTREKDLWKAVWRTLVNLESL